MYNACNRSVNLSFLVTSWLVAKYAQMQWILRSCNFQSALTVEGSIFQGRDNLLPHSLQWSYLKQTNAIGIYKKINIKYYKTIFITLPGLNRKINQGKTTIQMLMKKNIPKPCQPFEMITTRAPTILAPGSMYLIIRQHEFMFTWFTRAYTCMSLRRSFFFFQKYLQYRTHITSMLWVLPLQLSRWV